MRNSAIATTRNTRCAGRKRLERTASLLTDGFGAPVSNVGSSGAARMNVKAPSSAQAERKRAERGSTLLAGCIKRWRHRTLTGRSPSATVVEGCWLATIHGLSRDLQRLHHSGASPGNGR